MATFTPPPRFQAEFMLRRNIAELNAYSGVFRSRVLTAFADAMPDTSPTQDEDHDPLSELEDGPMAAAEYADLIGDEYYVAIETVRQGVVNLMVAGLYHLLEQQAAYSVEVALPKAGQPNQSPYGVERLQVALAEQGIAIRKFSSWSVIEELRLVANCVKHGEGNSAADLKKVRPELFPVNEHPLFPGYVPQIPIRPMVGHGVTLSDVDFDRYKAGVEAFWEEVVSGLLPIMRPDLKRFP